MNIYVPIIYMPLNIWDSLLHRSIVVVYVIKKDRVLFMLFKLTCCLWYIEWVFCCLQHFCPTFQLQKYIMREKCMLRDTEKVGYTDTHRQQRQDDVFLGETVSEISERRVHFLHPLSAY